MPAKYLVVLLTRHECEMLAAGHRAEEPARARLRAAADRPTTEERPSLLEIDQENLEDSPLFRRVVQIMAARAGRKGGLARAAKLSAQQRSEVGRKAVAARWARKAKE